MKTIRNFARVLSAIAIVLLLLFVAWQYEALSSFRYMPAANYAKEYCSCRYVLKHDKPFCEKLLQTWVPITSLTENSEQRLVAVEAFAITQTASWKSQRYGCRLEKFAQ